MWKTLFNTRRKDDLLSQAWNDCYQALEVAQEMFLESVRFLREKGTDVDSREIRRKDKRINKYQREIRRKVMTHCSVQGGGELPGGMILISIIIDVERIGDNAKNILDLTQTMGSKLYIRNCEEILQEIEKDIQERFNVMIMILKEHEVDQARKIMTQHQDSTRHVCDNMIDDLLKGNLTGITPADSAALALYLRYLKRISAHLKNVATSVVNPFDRIGFKEKRPKG